MLLPGQFLDPELEAKAVTPRLSVSQIIDGFNGNYVKGVEDGDEGHMILNGGASATTGILGGPNQFKSTLADHMTYSPLDHYYDNATSMTFDTEDSKEYLAQEMRIPYQKRILQDGIFGNPRIWMTKQSIMFGDQYWDGIRKPFGEAKLKEKDPRVQTPFLNKGKDLISILPPTFEQQDSFSRMNFGDVEKKFHNATVDSKDRNMEFTRPGLIKTRILSEMPTINPQHGFYTVMTAHLGEDMMLDAGYGATPKKVLANLGAGQKIKGCPEQFLYLTNNLWFCANQKPHWDGDMTPWYGRNGEPGKKGEKDVVEVKVMNLRGKAGASGSPFPMLASQALGFLPFLTMFNYLRADQKYFGMAAGNNTNMALDFVPDIKMTRNKVWETIDNDYRLQRALELTTGLCQIRNMMWHLGNVVMTPPEEIFRKLKEQGYDWDVILGETRGQWQFTNVKSEKKYLSALDLLRMYKGEWMPEWLGKPRNAGK
jgi:hypothetical protein